MKTTKYDTIGIGYDATRTADPVLADMLCGLLQPVAGGRYLDVACGSGNYTCALAARGLRMYGVDQSATMLEQARGKCAAVDWHMADAEALPFADKTFDGVSCTLAIHHFRSLDTAFAEVARVMRGGRFVLLTSLPEQMDGYWLNEYFPVAMQRSRDLMPTMERIGQALATAGLRVEKVENYSVHPELEDLFLYCGKFQPERYFRADIRAGISTFSAVMEPAELEQGLAGLDAAIRSGTIDTVRQRYENNMGDYAFVVAAF